MTGDYLDRLEAELRAAVPRVTAGATRPRRAWRPRPGDLAVVLGMAVAVLVVLVAVGVHAHKRPPARPPARHHRRAVAGEDIYTLGAVPTLAQLMDNFAVLRRPQTAADRSWNPECGCAGSARQFNGLTREARTLPGGYRIFFDVEQFIQGGQLNTAAGSYNLNLDIVGPHASGVSSTSFGPNTQFTIYSLSSGGPPSRRGRGGGNAVVASAVPDGVASVTWTFGCRVARRARGRGPGCAGVRTQRFTVPVVDNVAARQTTGLARCLSCSVPDEIVWRASDGSVVASFPGFGNLPAAPFVKGGMGNRVLRVLLPNELAGTTLGESASVAIGSIDRELGPAADANVAAAGCGIDHESVWTSPAVADPLTIYERQGRFVGYQYGAPVDEIGLRRGPGAELETARGLTLADTIGSARRLYGTGLTTAASRGSGTWRATGDGGTLRGFALPTIYPLRRVTDKNPVATIGAGDTGCAPDGTR